MPIRLSSDDIDPRGLAGSCRIVFGRQNELQSMKGSWAARRGSALHAAEGRVLVEGVAAASPVGRESELSTRLAGVAADTGLGHRTVRQLSAKSVCTSGQDGR